MTTVPDIPVVQLPALEADGVVQDGRRISPGSIWAVDIPHARRITPVTLVALGVAAGIAAMALGAAAVLFAGSSSSPFAQTSVPAANASPAPVAEVHGSTTVPGFSRRAGRRAARARAPCEAEHRADRVSRRTRARSGRGERRSRGDPAPRTRADARGHAVQRLDRHPPRRRSASSGSSLFGERTCRLPRHSPRPAFERRRLHASTGGRPAGRQSHRGAPRRVGGLVLAPGFRVHPDLAGPRDVRAILAELLRAVERGVGALEEARGRVAVQELGDAT